MSTFGKAYLLAYNAAQFAGWSYMLYVSAPFFWPTLSGAKSSLALYHAVWPALSLFQTAAVLEILHAAVGLVRSSVFLTAFQVG